MYRNNEIIYEATSKLKELVNIQIMVDSIKENAHAGLTIGNSKFTVETRFYIRTSHQDFILIQLKEMKNNSDKPIVLIAEYISKKATQELKERGINHMDVDENTFIKHNDLAIFVMDKKNTEKDNINQSREFQETGLKIIFHLLDKPENFQESYRRIVELADVSVG